MGRDFVLPAPAPPIAAFAEGDSADRDEAFGSGREHIVLPSFFAVLGPWTDPPPLEAEMGESVLAESSVPNARRPPWLGRANGRRPGFVSERARPKPV